MGKIVQRHLFSSRVMAVAVVGAVGDWSAYIDAVPGHNHDLEMDEVSRTGNKLPYEIAKILFPDLPEITNGGIKMVDVKEDKKEWLVNITTSKRACPYRYYPANYVGCALTPTGVEKECNMDTCSMKTNGGINHHERI